jgi:tetratricopeptide (TPR) repeat protein
LDDSSPEIQYELGKLLGGTPEALDLLQRAVAGRPNWAEAQAQLGESLLAAGENEAAKAAFQEAMRLNDQLAEAHNGVGRALAALGQYEAAEAALRRALELVPNDPVAMLALANLFRDSERYEEAFEHYRKAADLNPRNPRPLLFATKLALHLRRDVLAAGFLDRLLETRPTLAPALVLYGHVMQMRRNYPHAIQYYERSLEGEGDIDPDRVRQTLRELRNRRPRRHRRSRQIP